MLLRPAAYNSGFRFHLRVSWLYSILVMAGAAVSLVAWFCVMALGAISGNLDLNLSFRTSHFSGKSFHDLS